jgi:hypothetical protein
MKIIKVGRHRLEGIDSHSKDNNLETKMMPGDMIAAKDYLSLLRTFPELLGQHLLQYTVVMLICCQLFPYTFKQYPSFSSVFLGRQ